MAANNKVGRDFLKRRSKLVDSRLEGFLGDLDWLSRCEKIVGQPSEAFRVRLNKSRVLGETYFA